MITVINKPDFETAAIKAMEILIENNITETPINTMPILLSHPEVRVMPFTSMADRAGVERDDLVPLFGSNQDAATFHLGMNIHGIKYVVVYNMRLPYEMIWRGIARELGHIVLGHDGATRTAEARMAEALCFAHHLISPRPIINLILQSGMPLTMSALANTTGCSDECVEDMQQIPGVHVPKELNRQVRNQFERGINEYIRFHISSPMIDRSPLVDLGTYMDNYVE